MYRKHTARLRIHNLMDINGKVCMKCFLVVFLCVVLPGFYRLQNTQVAAAQLLFQLKPRAVKFAADTGTAIGIGLT